MNDAQKYIQALQEQGMSITSIAAALGKDRATLSRIANGKQDCGRKTLLKLYNVYRVSSGEHPITTALTPHASSHPTPDIPPRTEEQLQWEEQLDTYAEWEPLEPVGATISAVIEGARGQLTEMMLPSGFSVIRTPSGMDKNARVVESVPRPPRPRQEQYIPTQGMASHPFIALITLAFAFIFKPTNQQREAPTQRQAISPRYVPTQQFPKSSGDTTQALHLSQPVQIRPSSLGYTSNYTETPQAPTYGTLDEYFNQRRR